MSSGADFLSIDSGARSQGMGGAFTAMADDVNALTWNPAGLALLQRPEIGYLRMLYFNDIAYNFGGAAMPLPAGPDTFGLGAGVINMGTSFDSTLGIAPAVSTGDNAFFLGAAFRAKQLLAFGVTGKFILRQIAGYNASAFGGDAGILLTPGDRFRLGAGIYNLGTQVKFISEADPLPLTGRLGLAYKVLDIPHHSLSLALDNSWFFGPGAYQGAVGAEYWLDKTLALRAGYTGDAYQQHWTAGAGINLKLVQLDYAYAPAGTLGDTHRLSFILRFGAGEAAASLLAPPSGFTVHPLDGAAELNWSPSGSKEVVGYNLYVKRPGDVSFLRLTGQPVSYNTLKLKNLKNGQSYSFAVASVGAAGRESSYSQLTVVPEAVAQPQALQPPAGFKAEAEGAGVLLSWDKTSLGMDVGCNLYTADGQGQKGVKLTEKPILDGKALLKKVAPDRTYRFLLTAVDKSGMESQPTAPLDVNLSALQKAQSPAPVPAGSAAPASLDLVGGDGMVSLNWEAVPGAVGYHLYVSYDGQEFRRLTTDGPRTLQKVVLKPVKNGKTYYFGVSAVMSDGQESPKTVRSIVPGPSPTAP